MQWEKGGKEGGREGGKEGGKEGVRGGRREGGREGGGRGEGEGGTLIYESCVTILFSLMTYIISVTYSISGHGHTFSLKR